MSMDDDGEGPFGGNMEKALPHRASCDEAAMDDEDNDNVSTAARVRPRERDRPQRHLSIPRRPQSLQEWALKESRTEISKRLGSFLRTTVDSMGNSIYLFAIRAMCHNKQSSFIVNFRSLASKEPAISQLLLYTPLEILEIFDEVGTELVLRMFHLYQGVIPEIHVRISDLPVVETLRSLRMIHLNHLVRTFALVTAKSGVLPQLSIVKYDCADCGPVMGPFVLLAQNHEVIPVVCPKCKGMEPFPVTIKQTVYRSYQKITIQESPCIFPRKYCFLLGDLIDSAEPGDEVDITGIYVKIYDGMNTVISTPVFSTGIVCNHMHNLSAVPA